MKRLSGKDVMPGDFVQRPGYGIGYVVECSNTHLLVDFNGKSEHLEWCKSVLLTAEIIESMKDRYRIYGSRFFYEFRDDIPGTTFYYVSIRSRNEAIHFSGHIKYVHELQHALSLAGYRNFDQIVR